MTQWWQVYGGIRKAFAEKNRAGINLCSQLLHNWATLYSCEKRLCIYSYWLYISSIHSIHNNIKWLIVTHSSVPCEFFQLLPVGLYVKVRFVSRRVSSLDGAGFTHNPLRGMMPQSSLMDKYQSLQLYFSQGSEVTSVPSWKRAISQS